MYVLVVQSWEETVGWAISSDTFIKKTSGHITKQLIVTTKMEQRETGL